jgi:hypothetical protein
MHKNHFTRIGFILAAAGSAVGLGNIWKFPYIAGENGGGVFVLVYLATVFLIGMSIFIGEVLLGSNSNHNAVSTFETLAPKEKKYWKYSGFTFLTGLLILTFYSVVIAWIFNYIVISVTSLPSNFKESETIFLSLLKESIYTQLIYYTLTFVIVAITISKGVKKGIEKMNNILMPSLVIILLILLIYSIQLDGFMKAVNFMFYPNFEKFHSSSIIIDEGLVDEKFVEEKVNNYDLLKNKFKRVPVTKMLKRTGLSPEQFEEFWQLYKENQNIITAWTMGINQSSQGVDKNLSIINTHLLTGKIFTKGNGLFSLTGQPNAMGGREVGGLSTMLAVHLGFDKESIKKVNEFWKTTKVSMQLD